jgi:hypothetical protein
LKIIDYALRVQLAMQKNENEDDNDSLHGIKDMELPLLHHEFIESIEMGYWNICLYSGNGRGYFS